MKMAKTNTGMRFDCDEYEEHLKRIDRVIAIHSTLAIEGNSLSLEETAAIIYGKEFADSLKEFVVYEEEMMIDHTDSFEEE